MSESLIALTDENFAIPVDDPNVAVIDGMGVVETYRVGMADLPTVPFAVRRCWWANQGATVTDVLVGPSAPFFMDDMKNLVTLLGKDGGTFRRAAQRFGWRKAWNMATGVPWEPQAKLMGLEW